MQYTHCCSTNTHRSLGLTIDQKIPVPVQGVSFEIRVRDLLAVFPTKIADPTPGDSDGVYASAFTFPSGTRGTAPPGLKSQECLSSLQCGATKTPSPSILPFVVRPMNPSRAPQPPPDSVLTEISLHVASPRRRGYRELYKMRPMFASIVPLKRNLQTFVTIN